MSELVSVIVKWGDDLRQELLCSQLLEQFRVSGPHFDTKRDELTASMTVHACTVQLVIVIYVLSRLCGAKKRFLCGSDRKYTYTSNTTTHVWSYCVHCTDQYSNQRVMHVSEGILFLCSKEAHPAPGLHAGFISRGDC